MVRASDLVVARGRTVVLDGIDLDLRTGLVAVVGRNGCGKSSLLRVLATLDEPRSGTLTIGGLRVDERRERGAARRLTGYLTQEWDFPRGATVQDAVRYGAWLHRVDRSGPAVDRALARHDLASVGSRRLAALSTGTRRRVGLAQATVHDPRLLLLDEPTAGLDVEQRQRLWSSLHRQCGERLAMVVTHDLLEVREHCDLVVVLADGGVAHVGTPQGLADTSGLDAEEAIRRLASGIETR